MGLLGDVYSYGDTLKRKVGGLLSDPRGTLEQFVGQLGDDMNTNISNMKTGYGFGGNKSVLSDPAQVQAAQRALADYGAQSGMAAATVWHGSPHKFDKFDSSKIGTGEGAQAYGHGLYLAESPDVAQSYQKNLSQFSRFDGKPISGNKDLSSGAKTYLLAENADLPKAIQNIKDAITRKPNNDLLPPILKELESISPNSITKSSSGFLYKVDLPDEHIAKMLDWDKPLSQQPQAFKDAVSAREQQRMMPILEQRRATLAGLPQGAENASILKKQIAILEDEITQPQAVPNMTGGEYFNYLRNREMAPAEQADWLRKAGIPGIRYLDGGSRGTGAGTSNFVVFPGNEGLLKILERNGGKP